MDTEDPDSDRDHSQNLIISSFYLFRHILKISSKSVHTFLSYLVHKRTDKPKNEPRGKHNLHGGGNYMGDTLEVMVQSICNSCVLNQHLNCNQLDVLIK